MLLCGLASTSKLMLISILKKCSSSFFGAVLAALLSFEQVWDDCLLLLKLRGLLELGAEKHGAGVLVCFQNFLSEVSVK